jgi:hypothetical protein
MALARPDWLAQRGGDLKLAGDGHTWLVMFDGGPQYAVEPVPVQGKFGGVIKQTTSGKRIECTAIYPTEEQAVRGALEDLRKSLGW